MKKKKKKAKKQVLKRFDPSDIDALNKKLGYKTLIKPPKHWLDTGSSRLNSVMGSKEKGLATGKIYLIAGTETSGKSLLAAKLAGKAQKNKFQVAWVDGENSFDGDHVRRQGLHPSRVALFRPEYGVFGKRQLKENTIPDVEPAEYMLTRLEYWMKLMRNKNQDGKLFIVIDSTNSFVPQEEMDAGYTDQNMRTRLSPAMFLNKMTKSLSLLAIHTNAIVILISQLRTNPAKMFGNPNYISGGGGLKYFPSSIVWMRRIKDGAIKEGKTQVGVKGLLTNTKNKVGGGSVERKKAGYLTYFFKDKWKFVSAAEMKGND